jgi:hypothetical protein
VMRSFPAQEKALGWCFYPFSSAVYLFLPTNLFVGLFSFTTCSYTSSCLVPSFISPASSLCVRPSLVLILTGDYGNISSICQCIEGRSARPWRCHCFCVLGFSIFEVQDGWISVKL